MDMDEALALEKRFKTVRNRAEFAREVSFPGGPSMIYQNIKGLKPISIEGAFAYARGFRCSIEEISPSIAARLAKIPLTANSQKAAYGGENVTQLPLSGRLKELVEIARKLSDEGQIRLLERANALMEHYTAQQKTASSSSSRH